ncbi:MAG: S8 family serine peptidase, partial [Candidatus Zixiibacteriota bacterium]
MRSHVKFLFSIVLVSVFLMGGNSFTRELIGETPDGSKYILDKMLVTIKPGEPFLSTDNFSSGIAVSGVASLDELSSKHLVTRIEPFYPGKLKSPILKEFMDRLYIFTVSSGEDIFEVIADYRQNDYLEWVDPYIVPELDYLPNDPSIDNQWALPKIQAFDAWDYVRGDKTKAAIIGISDTGVYWYHPDLEDNMWINEPEDINGTGRFENYPDYQGGDLNWEDDDGNGYVDDVLGWDCYYNDPDPAEGSPIHGTHVAGCASEVTDNGEGGAGIGFSARIIAAKGADDNGNLYAVYTAITYCSDQGADIVNCSWGSGSYQYTYQQLINRAWENGTQVVASAGNEGNSFLRYPASYEHVISVAATDQSDHKAGFSSWGDSVDVSAPGVAIYSTWGESGYASLGGTSMAAPITSGTLALLIAQDTSRTPDD